MKQALNHGLTLKRVHRVVEFNQKAWLKPYIDMNKILSTKVLNDFGKDFFKLMKNFVFGYIMENMTLNLQYLKKTSHLVSQQNYHSANWFTENRLVVEMDKAIVKMKKLFFIDLLVLDVSKIVIHEYWFDYLKYGNNVKLCYMNKDSFIVNVESEEVYADLTGNIEKRFDTPKYEVDILLPTAKSKKGIHLMKDELG